MYDMEEEGHLMHQQICLVRWIWHYWGCYGSERSVGPRCVHGLVVFHLDGCHCHGGQRSEIPRHRLADLGWICIHIRGCLDRRVRWTTS